MPSLLVAPAAPQPETPHPVHVRAAAPHDFSEFNEGRITAPPRIPTIIRYVDPGEQPFAGSNIALDSGTGIPGGDGSPFGKGQPVTIVRPPAPRSSAASLEVCRRVSDLQEHPAVSSHRQECRRAGHRRSAGHDLQVRHDREPSRSSAVRPCCNRPRLRPSRTWRYRPYLLNEQPVEVETTVNVIFKLER